jgi:hypothetical protein
MINSEDEVEVILRKVNSNILIIRKNETNINELFLKNKELQNKNIQLIYLSNLDFSNQLKYCDSTKLNLVVESINNNDNINQEISFKSLMKKIISEPYQFIKNYFKTLFYLVCYIVGIFYGIFLLLKEYIQTKLIFNIFQTLIATFLIYIRLFVVNSESEYIISKICINIIIIFQTLYSFIDVYIIEKMCSSGEIVFDFVKLFHYIIIITISFIFLSVELLFDISSEYLKYIFISFIFDILYHLLFSYYLVFVCENLTILNMYSLDYKITELLEKYDTLEQSSTLFQKLNFTTFQHICFRTTVEESKTEESKTQESKTQECNIRDCPCGICFNPLTTSVKLKCNHIFDEICIKKWSIKSYLKYKRVECPTCRINLVSSI